MEVGRLRGVVFRQSRRIEDERQTVVRSVRGVSDFPNREPSQKEM